MENPFVNVLRYLDTLPKRQKSQNNRRKNSEHILNNLQANNNKQIRDKGILLLSCRYNLKPSEIIGLDLDDVNLEAGLITVASQKMALFFYKMRTFLLFVYGGSFDRCINEPILLIVPF